MTPTSSVPMPGEIHPAYADRPELLTWLEGDRYPEIRLPVPRPSAFASYGDPNPSATAVEPPPVHVMRRRKCAGPAPYVGHPFVYVWPVGEDELGRCIAGAAQIHYLE